MIQRSQNLRLVIRSLVVSSIFLLLALSLRPALAQTLVQRLDVDYGLFDISWSPDGELLTVSSTDGIVIYTPDLEEVGHLHGHQISWKSDALQSASVDKEIYIWQRQSDNTFTLERTLSRDGYVQEMVAWSPDGKWLASQDMPDTDPMEIRPSQIHIWDMSSWQLERTLPETYFYPDYVNPYPFALKWSPDSTRIAGTGYKDNVGEMLFISNVLTRERVVTIPPVHGITSLDWSSTGLLAIADDTYGIFDVNMERYLYSPLDARLVDHLAWSPDGNKLALTNDGSAEIRDYATNQLLATLPNATGYFAWHPSGNMLAAAERDPNTFGWAIQIWDVSSLPSVEGVPTLTPYPNRSLMPTPTPAS